MLGAFAKRLLGSANDRFVKSLRKTIDAINDLEPALEGLSDAELRARTAAFARASTRAPSSTTC